MHALFLSLWLLSSGVTEPSPDFEATEHVVMDVRPLAGELSWCKSENIELHAQIKVKDKLLAECMDLILRHEKNFDDYFQKITNLFKFQ